MPGLRMTEEQLKAMLAKHKPRQVRPLDELPQNKYRATPTEVDGINFDSKKEAKRYQTLDALQAMGKIQKLRHHVSFDLVVNGESVARYEADFTYMEEDKLVIEDVKGMRKGAAYDMFRLKSKLMKAIYGADIREV